MKKMNSVYILAAVFVLKLGTADASAKTTASPVNPFDGNVIENPFLIAPNPPAVATFDDGAPVAEVNAGQLAPVTPVVAEFEEVPGNGGLVSPAEISPVTPAEADFGDHI